MGGKRLLVADDSLTIQKVIRLALSNEGYDIHAVSDGHEALTQIAVLRPDAVLIDVSLPGRSAFEVKAEIAQELDLDRVKFILMSSAFEEVDEARVGDSQFSGRLIKPFDPANLRRVLEEVLGPHSNTQSDEDTTGAYEFNTAPAAVAVPALPPEPIRPAFKRTPPRFVPISQADEAEHEIERTGFTSFPQPPQQPPPLPPQSFPQSAPTEFPLEDTPLNNDLWDLGENRGGHDDDIRQLTESTMRMTDRTVLDQPPAEIDETSWSISEAVKPPSPSFESFDSSSQWEGIQTQERTLEPTPAILDFSQRTDGTVIETSTPEPVTTAPGGASLSEAQLEAIIRDQVAETLKSMAERLLPEIAERVIREEIHRLLARPPNAP